VPGGTADAEASRELREREGSLGFGRQQLHDRDHALRRRRGPLTALARGGYVRCHDIERYVEYSNGATVIQRFRKNEQ
jgi:hypothetical protein